MPWRRGAAKATDRGHGLVQSRARIFVGSHFGTSVAVVTPDSHLEMVSHEAGYFEPEDLAPEHPVLDNRLGPVSAQQGDQPGVGGLRRRQRGRRRRFHQAPALHRPDLQRRPGEFQSAPGDDAGRAASGDFLLKDDVQRGRPLPPRPRQGATQTGYPAIVDQHPRRRVVLEDQPRPAWQSELRSLPSLVFFQMLLYKHPELGLAELVESIGYYFLPRRP
jgi:hypothetical protein